MMRDHAGAARWFDQLMGRLSDADVPWDKVAASYLETGRVHDALRACERGFAQSGRPNYSLSIQAGLAHILLGDQQAARERFLAAATAGNHHEACWYLLLEPARRQDPRTMLTQCDALEARFGNSSVFRAVRAIAYSMLNETTKARALVDLERHVRTHSIREYLQGDLEEFNARLAQEALAIGSGAGSWEKTIVPHANLSAAPAMRALQGIVRRAISAYLREAPERGLEQCLPLPIGRASLSTGVTLLRGDGCNGQHIHMASVISSVYHLTAPQKDPAEPDAGALKIGAVDQYAGGHKACWGELRILPEPGQLTVFPAHFFHDVIPTRSREIRISFPSDVHLVT